MRSTRLGWCLGIRALPVFACFFAMICARPAPAAEVSKPRERVNYGALLEHPTRVLHGAGQTCKDKEHDAAFERYAELVGADRFPVLFMAYCNVRTGRRFFTDLRARLEGYQQTAERYTLPQIGLSIPSGNAEVDPKAIETLVANLKAFGRPAFIRIGYEFNGLWYKPMFQPASYKAWFQAISKGVRAAELPVATVWCACPGYHPEYGKIEYIAKFYPGDRYVDWWGMDIFSPGEMATRSGRFQKNPETGAFLVAAAKRRKPVLIGEATPRFIGGTDEKDWETWYAPFFEMINTWPHIKAHTYINWNWKGTRWPDWGDARLETAHKRVREGYLEQIGSGLYLHARSGELPKGMRLP
jgi:hypothetical protein